MSSTPEQIGRYRIVERVGRGGMGVLYRAHDPALERDVALKMMHLDFTSDTHARERFQREARAVARLQHPNIVTIHELGEVDDTPYIVMEFLEGKDLEQLLKDGDELSLGRKLDIAAQVCEGLAYAHDQGIVHRDIKPGNVRVLPDGKVKILDFGIARFAASSLTQSGTVMGTPSYMAPEQIMGQPVDGRADLFAAGVLLYELLSGRKPFTGDSPTAVAYNIMHSEPPALREALSELPDAVNEIVARALRKDPNERYTHAREMASDLQTVRMMLDLPLTAEAGRGLPSSATTTVIASSDLFATASRPAATPRPGTAARAADIGDAAIRPSTEAALADAAPGGRAAPRKTTSALAVVGIMVGGVLVGAWLLMQALSGGGDGASTADANGVAVGGAAATGTGAAVAASPQTFRVTSDPAGAAIALDGADTGLVTPADVPLGGATPGQIRLTLDGHDTLTADISAEDLAAGTKAYELVPAPTPTRLTVTAPYPFEIIRGSTVVSPAASSHTLTVDPDGPNVVARNAELLLSQRLSINFRRQTQVIELPATGTLTVFAANEQCTVVADGRDLGPVPIRAIPVAAGTHTVVLRCPDGSEARESARVASGADTRVTFPGQPMNGARAR